MAADVKLAQISLAAVRVEAMIDFYNGVLGAGLAPVEGYSDDEAMYRGTLAGVALLIVPNEIAGVTAEQGRHQLHLTVSDVAAAEALVQEFGGTVEEEVQGAENGADRTVVVRDPDGNTLVLT
jgi:catechol 2,3-dioxygenase-like lactoylglutathione lyase family enzyme